MNPKRLLVVDDELKILELVRTRLETLGYHVITASDGHEALAKAHTERPDLVILDVMLPKLNGYEICTLLKQDARYRHLRIILCTAKAEDQDERLGMACGADAYVRKPCVVSVLVEQVQALLAPVCGSTPS